jgi:hypothetical protein
MPIFALIVAAIAAFTSPIQHHAIHEQHLAHIASTRPVAVAPVTAGTPATSNGNPVTEPGATAPVVPAGMYPYPGGGYCNSPYTGGPVPGNCQNPDSGPTDAQGCHYVKMGEAYCPSTGTYVPMTDPNTGESNTPAPAATTPTAPLPASCPNGGTVAVYCTNGT